MTRMGMGRIFTGRKRALVGRIGSGAPDKPESGDQFPRQDVRADFKAVPQI
jgi:hypothetical protein